MTQAAAISTNIRNGLIECLAGKASSLSGATGTPGHIAQGIVSYLQLYSSVYGDTSAAMGAAGAPNVTSATQWGSAIGGTAPFTASWTSNVVTASVKWARFLLANAGNFPLG